MKNKFTILFLLIIIPFFFSCEKEMERLDNFLVEFAIVLKTASSTISFKLDNGTILIPEKSTTNELENGNRVLMNYTPLENNTIQINNIRKVFMESYHDKGYPEKVIKDPIKVISIWQSGKYLNMSFVVDYHSKTHTTGLFRDIEAEETTFYFSYSREEDPPGAPTQTYLSFNMEELQDKNFTVIVNTYDGVRKFEVP
ncbi:MAG: NigD-like C-terminal domain-containing protein [Dysgonamonadaceae bacterium]|nr:NigD-like C-terminal domain-containing protein [Dysgonamonadaceae bacterium]MDD4728751.1 NigD-like C-terminal domain-containing protein [Dysgonamonadaceae bacterium]